MWSDLAINVPHPPIRTLLQPCRRLRGAPPSAVWQLVLLGFSLALVFTPPLAAQDFRISEFMAANTRTLADEDGDYPDWIEIHNAGVTPASLFN